MNTAELVKFYRAVDGIPDEQIAMTLDHWENHRSKLQGIAEDLDLHLDAHALRWVLTLRSMPWIYCHDCGELATVMDRMEEATEGACACWDDPPPWVNAYGDMGYDPADTIPPEGWTPRDDAAVDFFIRYDDAFARIAKRGTECLAEVIG